MKPETESNLITAGILVLIAIFVSLAALIPAIYYIYAFTVISLTSMSILMYLLLYATILDYIEERNRLNKPNDTKSDSERV
jgi:hypothetical protein